MTRTAGILLVLVLVLQVMKSCLGGHAGQAPKRHGQEGVVGPHGVTPQREQWITEPRLRSDVFRRRVLRFWRARSIGLEEAPAEFHLQVFPVQEIL